MGNNQSRFGTNKQKAAWQQQSVTSTLTTKSSVVAVLLFSLACMANQAAGAELSTAKKTSAATAQTQAYNIHELLASPPKAKDNATAAYLQDYYDIIADWGKIVHQQVKPVPSIPNCLYVGRPGRVENDVRPTAYAAMVLGFLSETNPPTQKLTTEELAAMRANAIGLLRYLAYSHVANEGTCADGKEWGKGWQSSLWTRAIGFTAWQLWPLLDEELRAASARMIIFEADRFIEQAPKDSLLNDTGAEENAWNASTCSLASCMFPNHARAEQWNAAAKKYMYNTFSVRADAANTAQGDDGKLIKEWVTTVNAHNDFTVENHRLVHVGYLKNSACLLQENAVHWLLVGQPAPAACNHHIPEVFDVLSSCMNWAGAAIYFAGNDWRLYETQCSDVILYSMMSTVGKNRQAAYLERVALDRLRQRQEVEGGYFNGRRDLEYGGLCATRLISCYAAHLCESIPDEVATEADFNQFSNGVRLLKSAKTILHRSGSKFASFSWAQQRMGLTIPRTKQVVWPHLCSYLGVINRKGPSERQSKLLNIDIDQQEDSFKVYGSLGRCKGQVLHDFYFASPNADYTVYIERVTPKNGYAITDRRTGLIGFQAPLGDNVVSLTGDFGEREIQGQGGEEAKFSLQSNWLNVGETIGYVVKRTVESDNVMVIQDRNSYPERYHRDLPEEDAAKQAKNPKNVMIVHDRNSFPARHPHLQEWVSLVSNEKSSSSTSPEWACIVTFVNVDSKQTQENQSSITMETEGDSAVVTVNGIVFKADFPTRE